MNLHPLTKEAYQLFHNGILALSRAEQAGLRVDVEYVETRVAQLTRRVTSAEHEFKQTNLFKHWQHSAGAKPVNIFSDDQLRYFLYEVKKLKPPKLTSSEVGSTDEDALRELEIPELELLIEIKKLKRLRDVNLNGFLREQVDGYIHPVFNLHLVRTFRSSSDHPNFQNIPKRDEESMQICRRALYPRPGHQLIEIDFKGIEVGVNACINQDPTLLRYQRDPASDMHADMARELFKVDNLKRFPLGRKTLRQAAKNGFVFPQFYGDYYKNNAHSMAIEWGKLPKTRWRAGQGIPLADNVTLSDHLISQNIVSYNAFIDHVQRIETDFWTNRFSEYAAWKERQWTAYKRNGYIDLPTGFRCSGVMGYNDVTNYPAQGSAFHCLLYTFTRLDEVMRAECWRSRLVGQIHDSGVADVHPDELKHVIETARHIASVELLKHFDWICVPMTVEIEVCEVDQPWSTKKELKIV